MAHMPSERGKMNLIVPPTVGDRRIASLLAARIVQAGEGRVRRVVMVGSRALGTASLGSDLDLVVLVEIPPYARPWGTPECVRERGRIQSAIGTPPLNTDLWVRTTDQYEEARRVAGSIEFLVDAEGIDVYSRPLERAPRVRRTVAQVRREYAAGWITHALRALDAATGENVDVAAQAAVERALHALLISHGIRASKCDGAQVMLSSIEAVDPAISLEVRILLGQDDVHSQRAREVLKVIVTRMSRDPGLAPQLRSARLQLSTCP
jgi:hypothetical protein